MLEVVFEVVSVGLEQVEGLVPNFPTGAAAGGKFGDGVRRNREIRDEAVVISPLSLVAEGLDGEPVDCDGIIGSAQWHRVEPALESAGALTAFADGLAMLLRLGAPKILGDSLMRGWPAGEDEVAAGVVDGGGDWLAGKQIIAEQDRPKMSDRGAVPCQPALRSVAFAVLLLGSVLRGDEYGG